MKHKFELKDPNFRVNNVDVQNVARPKGYKHTFKYGREKHGVIYVESGSMLYGSFRNYNMPDTLLKKGELLFVPKGCIYTGTYSEENTQIKIIQFEVSSGELPEYMRAPIKINLPLAHELIEDFFRPLENQVSYHPFYYLSCLYKLFWKIDENITQCSPKHKKIQPALVEISTFFNENQKVSYYAELCNMSEANFRKIFRDYTGMSPINYRNEIRLNNAKCKLQSGEYNVTEVAELCGFSNLSFFTRIYKKKYGHTPKKG